MQRKSVPATSWSHSKLQLMKTPSTQWATSTMWVESVEEPSDFWDHTNRLGICSMCKSFSIVTTVGETANSYSQVMYCEWLWPIERQCPWSLRWDHIAKVRTQYSRRICKNPWLAWGGYWAHQEELQPAAISKELQDKILYSRRSKWST